MDRPWISYVVVKIKYVWATVVVAGSKLGILGNSAIIAKDNASIVFDVIASPGQDHVDATFPTRFNHR